MFAQQYIYRLSSTLSLVSIIMFLSLYAHGIDLRKTRPFTGYDQVFALHRTDAQMSVL